MQQFRMAPYTGSQYMYLPHTLAGLKVHKTMPRAMSVTPCSEGDVRLSSSQCNAFKQLLTRKRKFNSGQHQMNQKYPDVRITV